MDLLPLPIKCASPSCGKTSLECHWGVWRRCPACDGDSFFLIHATTSKVMRSRREWAEQPAVDPAQFPKPKKAYGNRPKPVPQAKPANPLLECGCVLGDCECWKKDLT